MAEIIVGRNGFRHLTCAIHGVVIDTIELIDAGTWRSTQHCTRCLAAASGYRPWFFTGSPYGAEIAELANG